MKVLDHGYIELVETWGSDEAIVTAARQSTQKGFKRWGPSCSKCKMPMVKVHGGGWSPSDYEYSYPGASDCEHDAETPGDEKLLRFMWENQHSTPFEFAGAVIEVQAPIFVFREWHRHRTQSYSEASARYAPLPDLNYIPSVERLMMAGTSSRQTQGTGAIIDKRSAEIFRKVCEREYADLQACYEDALANGVAKELARVILPVGRYSRMRASANLRNWLGFLTLRQAPNAQWEIRQYANALHDMLAEKFPRTLALFDEGEK
jgi:thymidylate synthase (FAD)